MYAIFTNVTQYNAKLRQVNEFLGYPNNHGTETYYFQTAPRDVNNKCYMPVIAAIEHLFEGFELRETIQTGNEYEID